MQVSALGGTKNKMLISTEKDVAPSWQIWI